MAFADYYLCDICSSKTFYDAELDYGDGKTVMRNPGTGHSWPAGVGSMAVLCEECALTHKVKIVKKELLAVIEELS